MHQYKKMVVWQKSIKLVKSIYEITNHFPQSEAYGLTTQMRRCAVSIPSNIAEGSYRDSQKEFRRFLLISFGSGAELETQIQIAKDLTFLTNDDAQEAEELLCEVMKMLQVLQKKFSN